MRTSSVWVRAAAAVRDHLDGRRSLSRDEYNYYYRTICGNWRELMLAGSAAADAAHQALDQVSRVMAVVEARELGFTDLLFLLADTSLRGGPLGIVSGLLQALSSDAAWDALASWASSLADFSRSGRFTSASIKAMSDRLDSAYKRVVGDGRPSRLL